MKKENQFLHLTPGTVEVGINPALLRAGERMHIDQERLEHAKKVVKEGKIGLLEVTPEGVIIHGHHRAYAAYLAGVLVDVIVKPWSQEPGLFIPDLPIKRRQ